MSEEKEEQVASEVEETAHNEEESVVEDMPAPPVVEEESEIEMQLIEDTAEMESPSMITEEVTRVEDLSRPIEQAEEVIYSFTFEKKPEVKKLPCCILTPNDSVNPSYTNLVLPYRVICRQRYRRAGIKQRAQFAREVRQHEALQTNALAGVRVHREFCNPIVELPSASEIITLSEKQKRRLEEILNTNY